MIERFWDEANGGFFFTSSDHEELITRTREFFDNAVPSGNSVAALVLQKMSLLTGNHEYQQRALTIIRTVRQVIARHPSAFGYLLCALDFYLTEPKEIAIVGKPGSHEVKLMVQELYDRYLPNKVVAGCEPEDREAQEAIKLLEGRGAVGGQSTAYVCRNFTCLSPAGTVEEFAARLTE
jgi:uncharacterized protein YyaL (SSP411 family)